MQSLRCIHPSWSAAQTRRLRPLRRGLPRVHRGDPLNSESEAACRPGYFGVTLRYSLSWGVPRTKRCVPCCAAGCPSAAHCGPALGWGGSAGCDECPPGIVKLETGLHRLNPNQGSTDDTYRSAWGGGPGTCIVCGAGWPAGTMGLERFECPSAVRICTDPVLRSPAGGLTPNPFPAFHPPPRATVQPASRCPGCGAQRGSPGQGASPAPPT